MILGSDSHTRYGAFGTMAMGEGGPELVKQLLNKTYDIAYPRVVAIHLTGTPRPGVGPQDVALLLVKETFAKGLVKNAVMEFFGPGVKNLSMDYRCGIDVMTTETSCLSSVWATDETTKDYLEILGRGEEYKPLSPADGAYYDDVITVDLGKVEPMIALPFHPSNAYTIAEFKANMEEILASGGAKAKAAGLDKVPGKPAGKIRRREILCGSGGHRRLLRRYLPESAPGFRDFEGQLHGRRVLLALRLSRLHAGVPGADPSGAHWPT